MGRLGEVVELEGTLTRWNTPCGRTASECQSFPLPRRRQTNTLVSIYVQFPIRVRCHTLKSSGKLSYSVRGSGSAVAW